MLPENKFLWTDPYGGRGKVNTPLAPEPAATMEDLSPEVKSLIDRTDKQISEREKQEYYRRTGRDQFGRLMGEQPLKPEDHYFGLALAGLRAPVGQTVTGALNFLNPMNAKTMFGAALRTGLDSYGIAHGVHGMDRMHHKWAKDGFDWKTDVPEYGLHVISTIPGLAAATKALSNANVSKFAVSKFNFKKPITQVEDFDDFDEYYGSFTLEPEPIRVPSQSRTVAAQPTTVTSQPNNSSIFTENELNILDTAIDHVVSQVQDPIVIMRQLRSDPRLIQRAMERQLGRPFSELSDNYFFMNGVFTPRTQVVSELQQAGFTDDAINRLLASQQRAYTQTGYSRDIADLKKYQPIFSNSTTDYKLRMLEQNPRFITDEILSHFTTRMADPNNLGSYEIRKTPFDQKDIPVIQAAIDKYSDVPMTVQDLYDDPNALALFRRALREKLYANEKMNGDIDHMWWFQEGVNDGFLSARPAAKGAATKDAFSMMSSLPRGYRLAETNTSYDSEMLKLLGVQRAINKGMYGRGPNQVTIHHEPYAFGNHAQKERVYIQDIINKHLNDLTPDDIDYLNSLVYNSGSSPIKKYWSPTLESAIKQEYDLLGGMMSGKLNKLYKSFNTADPSLNLPDARWRPFNWDYAIEGLTTQGWTTPHIIKPGIQIQKHKFGNKLPDMKNPRH